MHAHISPTEKAADHFRKGYNCAQSTVAPFLEEDGSLQTALVLMSGFGGGMGGLRGMCGAVTGMVCILGLQQGGYAPKDNEAKTQLYRNIREAVEEFREKFGTTICRELLQKSGCILKSDPSIRDSEYYSKRPCAHFVREAVEIIERRTRGWKE